MNYRKLIQWTLLAIIIIYIVSGMSIANNAVARKLISKATAFEIHANNLLLILMIILLALHVLLPFIKKRRKTN